MPNWVTNNLEITGTKANIVKMFNRANLDGKRNYTMNSFVPMPQTYRDVDTTNNWECTYRDMLNKRGSLTLDEQEKLKEEAKSIHADACEYQHETYGVVGWYNWSVQNWGTKWDADLCSIHTLEAQLDGHKDEDEISVNLVFDTAWSPPVAFLAKVVEDNPELYFEMWCDEESGYKFAFSGCEGSLGDDYSNELYDKFYNEAKSMSAEDIKTALNGNIDDTLFALLSRKDCKDFIIEKAFAYGYWDRNGWVGLLEDFYYGCWEDCSDDFVRFALRAKTAPDYLYIADNKDISLGEDQRQALFDKELKKKLIEKFLYTDECRDCDATTDWETGFVVWFSTYDPTQI
jgi:hypothetical protein